MNLVNAWEEKVIEGLFNISEPAWPTGNFLAVFTSDPGESGSAANELPEVGGYARLDLSGKLSRTENKVSNNTTVGFEIATADWPEVSFIGFMASGTQGVDDMIVRAALVSPVTILTDDRLTFDTGNLQVEID